MERIRAIKVLPSNLLTFETTGPFLECINADFFQTNTQEYMPRTEFYGRAFSADRFTAKHLTVLGLF